MRGLVIVPTYNEVENIESLIDRVFAQGLGLDLVVVDDNSPDQTAQRVHTLIEKKYSNSLHILSRRQKDGIGSAYIAGLRWALPRSYSFMIGMDADLSHDPDHLPAFVKALRSYDLVIGSRYVQDGHVVESTPFRKVLSRGGNLYAQLMLKVPISDLTGGFNGYRRSLIDAVDINKIESHSYAFQVELKYRALKQQCRIIELPISFYDRKAGRSKMSKSVFFETLKDVTLLPWRSKKQLKSHT